MAGLRSSLLLVTLALGACDYEREGIGQIGNDERASDGGSEVLAEQAASGGGEESTGPGIVGKPKKTCNLQGQGWIAVRHTPKAADPENREAVCEEELVTWPCCAEHVKARFPDALDDDTDGRPGLTRLFAQYGAESFQLYNCTQAAGNVALHFLKVDAEGKWFYKRLRFAGSDVDPGDGAACADPGVLAGGAGLVLKADAVPPGTKVAAPATPGAAAPSPVPAGEKPVVAFAEVNPVLAVSCSGVGCHGADAAVDFFRYVDNEGNLKASKDKVKDRVLRDATAPGRMPPPSAQRAFPAEDRQKLLDFLFP